MLAWSSTPGGADPADWGKVVVDANAYETGLNCCLAEVDGKPAISYYELDNKVLKYAIRMGP